MIPKIIHFIWLGDEMPSVYKQWRDDWIRLHPGWEISTWDDGWCNVRAMPENFCHVRQKSNWMRLHILREHGGVYIDLDTQPFKNIEPLLDGRSACVTPFHASMKEIRICNSFLACEPEHPWMVECCERLAHVDPSLHLSMGSSLVSAALANHPCTVKVLDKNDILQRPFWKELGRKPESRWYAIHHFDNMRNMRKVAR